MGAVISENKFYDQKKIEKFGQISIFLFIKDLESPENA